MNNIPLEIEGRVEIQHKTLKNTAYMFVSYFAVATSWSLIFFFENYWLLFIFFYFLYIAYKSTKNLKTLITAREIMNYTGRYA
jgi:hypothetical protein